MTADPWTVRTPDLVLRRTVEADVEPIVAWRNQPEVTRWLLRTRVTADGIRERLRSLGPGSLPVSARVGDRIVATGFLDVVDGMGQDGGDESVGAEGLMGYVVDPAVAGRGYATQVAEALLAVAFAERGLHRVSAGCFADNVASWRVMEKVGMRREQHGVEHWWHAELGWVDGYTYALLRREWLAQHA